MIAIGYVRRSKESTDRSVSLKEQEIKIRKYAATLGWRMEVVIKHDGVSGADGRRFYDINAALEMTRARKIIVYHLDRLARDTEDALHYLKRWNNHGVEVHVVGRGLVDVTTSSGKLMTGVEALVAEHYRNVISEKTKAALALLKYAGRRYSGKEPYPADIVRDIKRYSIEWAFGNGLSLRALAKRLNEHGIGQRDGQPLAPSTLLGLLRREV